MKVDISFKIGSEKFNYRVCAIIIDSERILTMRHNTQKLYYSLPGGRVMMGETAEQAVIREVQEELGISLKISRPLWLDQAFFAKNADGLKYHELCIYFLMDISDTDLLKKGEVFTQTEGHIMHTFEWVAFDRLKDECLYPAFLKEKVYDFPREFTIRTELA